MKRKDLQYQTVKPILRSTFERLIYCLVAVIFMEESIDF